MKNNEFEINFIWVGNKKMPSEQLNNLVNITQRYRGAVINIWVTAQLLHTEMLSILSNLPINICDITSLSLDKITAPATTTMIEKLCAAQMWPSLSDVLRLIILTRKLKPGAPTKRLYWETDNDYTIALPTFCMAKEDIAVTDAQVTNNMNLAHKFMQMLFNKFTVNNNQSKSAKGVLFHLESNNDIRPDSFFVDVVSEEGMWLKKNLLTHFEILFSDYIINTCCNTIINKAMTEKLHYLDVINSFGHLSDILLRIIMLPKNPQFIKTNGYRNFCQHGVYAPASGMAKEAKLLDHGNVSFLIVARLHEYVKNRGVNLDYYAYILKDNQELCMLSQKINKIEQKLYDLQQKYSILKLQAMAENVKNKKQARQMQFLYLNNNIVISKQQLDAAYQLYDAAYKREIANFKQKLCDDFANKQKNPVPKDELYLPYGINNCTDDQLIIFNAYKDKKFSKNSSYQNFSRVYSKKSKL